MRAEPRPERAPPRGGLLRPAACLESAAARPRSRTSGPVVVGPTSDEREQEPAEQPPDSALDRGADFGSWTAHRTRVPRRHQPGHDHHPDRRVQVMRRAVAEVTDARQQGVYRRARSTTPTGRAADGGASTPTSATATAAGASTAGSRWRSANSCCGKCRKRFGGTPKNQNWSAGSSTSAYRSAPFAPGRPADRQQHPPPPRSPPLRPCSRGVGPSRPAARPAPARATRRRASRPWRCRGPCPA